MRRIKSFSENLLKTISFVSVGKTADSDSLSSSKKFSQMNCSFKQDSSTFERKLGHLKKIIVGLFYISPVGECGRLGIKRKLIMEQGEHNESLALHIFQKFHNVQQSGTLLLLDLQCYCLSHLVYGFVLSTESFRRLFRP